MPNGVGFRYRYSHHYFCCLTPSTSFSVVTFNSFGAEASISRRAGFGRENVLGARYYRTQKLLMLFDREEDRQD